MKHVTYLGIIVLSFFHLTQHSMEESVRAKSNTRTMLISFAKGTITDKDSITGATTTRDLPSIIINQIHKVKTDEKIAISLDGNTETLSVSPHIDDDDEHIDHLTREPIDTTSIEALLRNRSGGEIPIVPLSSSPPRTSVRLNNRTRPMTTSLNIPIDMFAKHVAIQRFNVEFRSDLWTINHSKVCQSSKIKEPIFLCCNVMPKKSNIMSFNQIPVAPGQSEWIRTTDGFIEIKDPDENKEYVKLPAEYQHIEVDPNETITKYCHKHYWTLLSHRESSLSQVGDLPFIRIIEFLACAHKRLLFSKKDGKLIVKYGDSIVETPHVEKLTESLSPDV